MSDHNLCSICGGYLFNGRPCVRCSNEKSELASASGSTPIEETALELHLKGNQEREWPYNDPTVEHDC